MEKFKKKKNQAAISGGPSILWGKKQRFNGHKSGINHCLNEIKELPIL